MERTYKLALHFVPTTTPVIYTCLKFVSKLCFIYNKIFNNWVGKPFYFYSLFRLDHLTNARHTQTNIIYNKLPKF